MSQPELKMEGRSGCKLIVEGSDLGPVIKKYSNSILYNSRLIKQAEKQESYYDGAGKNCFFSTVKVIEKFSKPDELSWFTMPYIFGEKYSDYLDVTSTKGIHVLLEKLLEYFDSGITTSTYQYLDKEVILSKMRQIRMALNTNKMPGNDYFVSVIEIVENQLPNTPLPFGPCHGDLTFSNILFGDSQTYLLDFLDSFIDSPLIDIVKMRQDTFFKWSVFIESQLPGYRSGKIVQIFNYFDKAIETYCDNLNLNEWYYYLQMINLLRIVPYVQSRNELLFIETSLKKLLK